MEGRDSCLFTVISQNLCGGTTIHISVDILLHICRKPRYVAGQWHNKRISATAVTSLNKDAAAGSGVFHAVRRQADSDAAMEHATLRRAE
jgi:hypothetical protein